jgi:hypothetical protein
VKPASGVRKKTEQHQSSVKTKLDEAKQPANLPEKQLPETPTQTREKSET